MFTTFRKLGLFRSSSEGGGGTLLGPADWANLKHWTTYVRIVGGGGDSPLGTSATVWPIVLAPDDRRWWGWSSRWNENWQGKPKYPEKICPRLEPGQSQQEAGDYPPQLWLFPLIPTFVAQGIRETLCFTLFLNPNTVGKTPWAGVQPVTKPLLTQDNRKHRINAHRHPCLELNSNPRSQCSSDQRQFKP
jgi:hypothetical protein